MFFNNTPPSNPTSVTFNSKSDAYLFMLNHEMGKGTDPLECATKAKEYADLIADGLGLSDPTPQQPEETGLKKYISYVKQLNNFRQAEPDLWQFATSVVGGLLAGLVGGGVVANEISQEEPKAIAAIKDVNLDDYE